MPWEASARATAVATLLFALALAPTWTAHASDAADPAVVIGIVDTGINPYHVQFRDDSPRAARHPSTYLPGYPADALALRLTLDAPDYASALDADRAAWAAVEPGRLYWIPGTRIVGFHATVDVCGDAARLRIPPDLEPPSPYPCHPGLDAEGHGTMVASRAAGATTGLCPDCLIASAYGFHEAFRFLTTQPWVDVSSNSWDSFGGPRSGWHQFVADVARDRPVVWAGGNGVGGFAGVTGQPAYLRIGAGVPGVITVGGHDNGNLTAWTASFPHVVADACDSWAADHRDLERVDPTIGGGTSAATPFVAGAAARLVLDARIALGDDGTTHRGSGVLAVGAPGATARGPLADGALTLDELKLLLYRTADPRPGETFLDGAPCDPVERGPAAATHATSPVRWADVPGEFDQYPLIGYGAVNAPTLHAARAILAGEMALPARPAEDAWRARDDAVRAYVHGTR